MKMITSASLIIMSGLMITATAVPKLNTTTIQGNYSKPLDLAVNSSIEYIILYPISRTRNPYRVQAWSTNAGEDLPVLLVVRQAKFVTSWQVPIAIESSQKNTLLFKNTSKTMCHDNMDNIATASTGLLISAHPIIISQSFILSVSTASYKNLNIHIELEEEKDFYVDLHKTYSLEISPSQPRYVFYQFNKDSSDTVVVEVDSADDVCLTVSVQDSKCPVLDSNKDIKYEGTYQTINRKGATTIKKKDFQNGFFLVFVAKPDNYDCSQENSVIPLVNKISKIIPINNSTVDFKIYEGIRNKDYLIACLGTLGILIAFGIVFTVVSIVFNRFGTISKIDVKNETVTDFMAPLTKDEIKSILQSENLTVDALSKHPKRIKRKSFNYLSHIFSIALFYSIPVVQLVVTYQRVVNQTGNQDLCYYNFLCAHPALVFSDFNHIYSNIGYIILGIFFIFSVIDRHTRIKITKDRGIPVHYGMFYAMGVALIIEGLLSGCYHICPSQSNYQFDTSFMYIMAVLIMVKLYQNRHADINASAYSTFSIVGAVIFIAMIGILNGSIVICSLFMVCYSILIIVLSFKIYFFNHVVNGLQEFKGEWQRQGITSEIFVPIRKSRFIFLVIANLLNFTMLGVGLAFYLTDGTDFATFLLGLLLGNTVIHCVFYTVMKVFGFIICNLPFRKHTQRAKIRMFILAILGKLIHHERICLEAIIYGLLSIACWAASAVFFLDAATLWSVTPAESRLWNQGCIVANFYDKHDVWHLLSAPGLYFTFMYLMYLDDDISGKYQKDLAVF